MSVRCACSCKSCVRSSPARRRRSLLSPPAAESPPALPRPPRNGDCTACARCLLLESPGPESRESCAPTECGGPSAPAEANPPRPRGGVRLTLQGRAQWEDETHLDEVLPSRTGPAAVAVRLEGGRQRREGEDGPSARSTQGEPSRGGRGRSGGARGAERPAVVLDESDSREPTADSRGEDKPVRLLSLDHDRELRARGATIMLRHSLSTGGCSCWE